MAAPTHEDRLHESPRRKIFLLMILVIGALIAIGFILMIKARPHDPEPVVTPPPISLLRLPHSTAPRTV